METNNISRLAPSFLPATAVLEMTYKCNHKCLFCSCPWEAKNNNFKKKNELSLDDWKNCIKLFAENGICNIAFTGGEPLLNKNIREIIKFAASCKSDHIETVEGVLVSEKKPPNLYLISNGLLVDDEIIDLCSEYNVHLSMSLPGLSTFKHHTRAGNPSKILENFSKAEKKEVSTTVNITVTKKNLFELYQTISEALIAGADSLLMNRFLPGGRGIKYAKELLLSKEEINEMLDIAEDVLKTSKRYGSVGTELPKCIIDTKKYEYLKVSTKCSAALDFFAVSPSGIIRACNHSPVELVHFSEFEKLKTNPYWQKFIQKDCDGGCREAAHIVCGELDAKDPVFVS